MKEKINIKECAADFSRCTSIILNATFNTIDVVTNGEKDNPTDENLRIASDFFEHLNDFVCYMEIYRDELKKFCDMHHDDIRRLQFERLDSLNRN